LREPRRDLNSRAILEEVRAKSVFRWRGWCGVFLGGVFEFKIGRCFGGCVGCVVASGSTI
jgi:hypothetical protein